MAQLPLLFGITLVGIGVALGFGPRRRPALCCALGLPLGLAVIAVLGASFVAIGIPHGVCTTGAAAALILIGSVAVALRRDARTVLARRTRITLALWCAAWLGLLAIVCSVNMSLLATGSHAVLAVARILALHDGVPPALWAQGASWAPFASVVHSLSAAVGVDYLYSLGPALLASFIPLFALLVWHGVRLQGASGRTTVIAIALVTFAAVSTYQIAFQLARVELDLATAIYFLSFVALVWFAERERDTSMLPAALLCLAGLQLQSEVTPFAAAGLLVVWVATTSLPRTALARMVGAYVLGALVFHGSLTHAAPLESAAWWATVTFAGAFGLFLISDTAAMRPLDRFVPFIVCAAVGGLVAFAFATRPDHMEGVVSSLRHGLLSRGWGDAWRTVVVFFVIGLFVRPAPRLPVAAFGIPIYAGVTFLAMWNEGAGPAASALGSAMMVHLFPLAVYLLAIRFVPLLAPVQARAADIGSAPLEPDDPAGPPAGPLALFGGRARALGLAFVAIMLAALAVNVSHWYAHGQTDVPAEWRLVPQELDVADRPPPAEPAP